MPKRQNDVGVSKNSGTPKSSILIGCSIINHPFWGTLIFGNPDVFFQSYPVVFLGWAYVYIISPGFRETTSFFGRFWFCWKRFILRRLAAMRCFCLLGGERLSFFDPFFASGTFSKNPLWKSLKCFFEAHFSTDSPKFQEPTSPPTCEVTSYQTCRISRSRGELGRLGWIAKDTNKWKSKSFRMQKKNYIEMQGFAWCLGTIVGRGGVVRCKLSSWLQSIQIRIIRDLGDFMLNFDCSWLFPWSHGCLWMLCLVKSLLRKWQPGWWDYLLWTVVLRERNGFFCAYALTEQSAWWFDTSLAAAMIGRRADLGVARKNLTTQDGSWNPHPFLSGKNWVGHSHTRSHHKILLDLAEKRGPFMTIGKTHVFQLFWESNISTVSFKKGGWYRLLKSSRKNRTMATWFLHPRQDCEWKLILLEDGCVKVILWSQMNM